MYKLIRFFNQNRKLIITILIIVLAVFIGLRLINHFVKIQNEQSLNNSQQELESQIGMENRNFEISGGETRDPEFYKSEKKVIDNFIFYCNNKNFEEAYNLLTPDCKDVMFPDVNTFIKEYGEKNFNTVKNYNIQAWNGNIYRVKIMEDLLANGKTADEGYIEQYYTVYDDELNINDYMGSNKYSNKTQEKANVNVTVERIDFYIDDAIVKIKVTNNRETSIMLNTRDYADNIYLSDDQNLKYVSILNEIEDDEFIIAPGETKEVSIKISMPYTKAENVYSFSIDNMLANYEQYEQLGESRAIQFKIAL